MVRLLPSRGLLLIIASIAVGSGFAGGPAVAAASGFELHCLHGARTDVEPDQGLRFAKHRRYALSEMPHDECGDPCSGMVIGSTVRKAGATAGSPSISEDLRKSGRKPGGRRGRGCTIWYAANDSVISVSAYAHSWVPRAPRARPAQLLTIPAIVGILLVCRP